MEIKSNIIKKLKKIYEGKSFSDRIVVITELFQNSYRAESKNIRIKLIDDILIFEDDGCGCKKPDSILVLDQSDCETTDEGFGIGLWSWLAVPDVESIELLSNDWKAAINAETIFAENNPIATTTQTDKRKGFAVKIRSPYFIEEKQNIIERIKSDGELQLMNVYLNGMLIDHKDLKDEVEGDFTKDFNNSLFTARLAIQEYCGYPEVYYEKRRVNRMYISEMTGIIEMKKGALTLQEPDRKNIIYDNKKDAFEDTLFECRKELYKEFIRNATEKDIDKYAGKIAKILKVKDYEKFILIDDIEDVLVDEVRSIAIASESDATAKYKALETLRKTIKKSNEDQQLSMLNSDMNEKDAEKILGLLNITNDNENIKWVASNQSGEDTDKLELAEDITMETIAEVDKLSIKGATFKKVNIEEELENYELEDEEICSDILVVTKKTKNKKSSRLDSLIKKTTRKVWVLANEIQDYHELIARAEYYGIKVFIAKNILYENIFIKHDVPYITEIEDGIRKKNFINNVGINTKKEQYYLELLQPVLQYFNLPHNTFLIGNLKMYIETVLNDVVVNREIIENKKGTIKICGLTDGDKIILDRRALCLKRFNLLGNDNLGVNELKALLATLNTIAHELAHLLYGTEDNTKEHFQKEDMIRNEIINLYLAL